jgi:pimeloyl-ACP methyl ester carboxylesterase
MNWTPISHGLRLEPILTGSPAALVVLQSDRDASAASLAPIAARWAMSVPTTAFLALETIEPPDVCPDAAAQLEDPAMLERSAERLASLLKQQLRIYRLDASRVVLVGFGSGGTLALHLTLRQGWRCAGVLAFAGKLARPLPRLISIGHKVRLIGRLEDDDGAEGSLRETVALLCARGIDARGVLLTGSALSAEAARHGGAYLVELVATAQRGDLFHFDEERKRAQRN